MMKIKHPAKFTDVLIPVFADMLTGAQTVLDPFAGTGKIHLLEEYHYQTMGVEIEPEWASLHHRTRVGNALCLEFYNNSIDAVCTSPVYGNRFSDSHKAMDNSRRRGYTHDLGRKLHPDNAGVLHFGRKYCQFHNQTWLEVWRVLRPDGIFVLNVKDFIRNKKRVHVTLWHVLCLSRIGFQLVESRRIPTPSLRYGQNHQSRIDYESVIKFRKGR